MEKSAPGWKVHFTSPTSPVPIVMDHHFPNVNSMGDLQDPKMELR